MLRQISLPQPWATLSVLGVQTIEVRGWDLSPPGDLIVHARGGISREGWQLVQMVRELVPPDQAMMIPHTPKEAQWPKSDVVGLVRYEGCREVRQNGIHSLWQCDNRKVPQVEQLLNLFQRGTYAWQFSTPYALATPIEARALHRVTVPDRSIEQALAKDLAQWREQRESQLRLGWLYLDGDRVVFLDHWVSPQCKKMSDRLIADDMAYVLQGDWHEGDPYVAYFPVIGPGPLEARSLREVQQFLPLPPSKAHAISDAIRRQQQPISP